MGMLHLHQLSRNAYRRADRIMANKPKYHSTAANSSRTTPSENGVYETIQLPTNLHIFFQIDREIVLSATDRRSFGDYCKDEIADNYSQTLDFTIDENNLVEVMVMFTFSYEIDENNDVSKNSEKQLSRFIEDITESLENDLPFVMVHKLHTAMRHIHHEYRKETIIEITTDGGVERLEYDNRGRRIKE